MNLQQIKSLSEIYNREEDFSADLAENLDALKVGNFENPKMEVNVDTLKADIVAEGVDDGTLVVENQFGKANWDHWGRLEAYARFLDGTVAVLVAEDFVDLMITTCRLRNNESKVNWYLIEVKANSHCELSFRHVAWPTIDPDVEYSEFWQPIRDGDFGDLFAGAPVPVRNEGGGISRSIRKISICLFLTNQLCYVQLYFTGENAKERRDRVMELFPISDYPFTNNDSLKQIRVKFPVLEKGKNDREEWDEIREELVRMGTDIFNKIKESDL